MSEDWRRLEEELEHSEERWDLVREACDLRKSIPAKSKRYLKKELKYRLKAASSSSSSGAYDALLPQMEEYVRNNPDQGLRVPNFKAAEELLAKIKRKDEEEAKKKEEEGEKNYEDSLKKLREEFKKVQEAQRHIEQAEAQLLREPKEIREAREKRFPLFEDGDDSIEKEWGSPVFRC